MIQPGDHVSKVDDRPMVRFAILDRNDRSKSYFGWIEKKLIAGVSGATFGSIISLNTAQNGLQTAGWGEYTLHPPGQGTRWNILNQAFTNIPQGFWLEKWTAIMEKAENKDSVPMPLANIPPKGTYSKQADIERY